MSNLTGNKRVIKGHLNLEKTCNKTKNNDDKLQSNSNEK